MKGKRLGRPDLPRQADSARGRHPPLLFGRQGDSALDPVPMLGVRPRPQGDPRGAAGAICHQQHDLLDRGNRRVAEVAPRRLVRAHGGRFRGRPRPGSVGAIVRAGAHLVIGEVTSIESSGSRAVACRPRPAVGAGRDRQRGRVWIAPGRPPLWRRPAERAATLQIFVLDHALVGGRLMPMVLDYSQGLSLYSESRRLCDRRLRPQSTSRASLDASPRGCGGRPATASPTPSPVRHTRHPPQDREVVTFLVALAVEPTGPTSTPASGSWSWPAAPTNCSRIRGLSKNAGCSNS